MCIFATVNNTIKAHIYLFLAQLIYALNYSVAKDLMPDHIHPFALVFLRIFGAMILFWALSFFLPKEKIEKSDLKKILLLALFGTVINQLFFIYGLSLTTPINSAIIMVSNPIVVIAFTLLILKEKITLFKLGGLFLGICGALTLLLFRGNFELGSETMAGDFLTLINSMSWATFVVLAKPLMKKYQVSTLMKWVFLFGFIMILPIGFTHLPDTNWSSFGIDVYLKLSFVVIATTFLAYLLNVHALKELSPSVVSMYIYFQPFLASLFAIAIGMDEINAIKIVSGILIILGVYLVSKK